MIFYRFEFDGCLSYIWYEGLERKGLSTSLLGTGAGRMKNHVISFFYHIISTASSEFYPDFYPLGPEPLSGRKGRTAVNRKAIRGI
jgi:hypothetical protein